MVRRILLILGVIAPLSGVTQADFTKEGQLQASATFSYGMMRDDVRNLYIHGLIRYYPEEVVSIRGDGYYFLNSVDVSPLRVNHQLFAGGFYHLPSPGVDPYIGFQPGVSLSARNDSILGENGSLIESASVFTPMTSIVFGFNYFGGKHFSLFLEGRFARGFHLSNSWPKYLDEFRLSFGLAWQIGLKKSSTAE